MAKQSIDDLKKFSEGLFAKQWPVLSLWQTLAEHFYPERADFTVTRNVGNELADNLIDSYPVLVRRDLGNSFAAMLRDGNWVKVGIHGEPDHQGQMWLDWATARMLKLMNHRSANFVRSTKEGDHDYATFGNCVISVRPSKIADGLVYQNWHLRDCAWFDNESGQVGGLVRKWKPEYHEIKRLFGDKCHKNILSKAHREPFKQADIRHIVIPSVMYDDDTPERFPYVSIFLDVEHNHIMEIVGMKYMMYTVPRFQTIAGSPYAYSPATVVGLPNARLIQAMTHTLLEAAERYARPPIIATQKAIRSDIDLSPDGVTWADHDYDERLGASLRTLSQDRGGWPIGREMREGVVDILSSAFYLNKLSLPEVGREMTAYEVAERMKQFRRENLPLFAPIESEYNGQLCESTFELCMNMGFFGSPYDIPESLRDADVQFKFVSPLTESEEEEKATRFQQVAQMLGQVAEFDPAVIQNMDFDTALRDAVNGIGAPSTWLSDLEQVMQTRQSMAAQQQMATAQQGAETVNAVAEAASSAQAAADG